MRVTGTMVDNQIIQSLNIDLERLNHITEQTSTGKQLNRPSDDPLAVQRVVNLNEALAGVAQYQRNQNYVSNWVSASETTLNSASSGLLRANSLAIRGANDATLTQANRDALADEVNGILENMVTLGNTQNEGKYIYGGFQTQAPPFQTTVVAGEITAVAYVGDAGVDQVEVDSGQLVNKNIPGNSVFQPAAGTDTFAALIALRDNLRSGNNAGIQAGIAQTDAARQQVTDQISFLGTKTNQLDLIATSLTNKKTGLTALESQLADTDMPAAIVQLQSSQNVLDAALQSSAKILQQSGLMDFLS